MNWNCFLYLFIIMLFIISCDKDISFDNSFDPHNTGFQSRLLIIDFEKDPDRSLWGYKHGLYAEDHGKTFNNPDYPDTNYVLEGGNHVLQLNYDVNKYAKEVWYQPLGDTIFFNAKQYNLKKLSLFARGEKGGEKFLVAIGDTIIGATTHYTNPALERTLSKTWQKYIFPLDSLEKDSVNLCSLKVIELQFKIEKDPDIGTIFIDELAFEWD